MTSFGFTFVSFIIVSWVTLVGSTSDFCETQNEKFQACSNRMQHIYLTKGQELDTLCSEMAQYLSCVHETNVSCPDMPIFGDQIYTDAILNAKRRLVQYCSGHVVNTKCSQQVIAHLTEQCTAIVNGVQEGTPRDVLCRYSNEYLACLERATSVCEHDAGFIHHNIPQAQSSTMNAMKAFCNDVVGDDPGPLITPDKVDLHPVCSQANIMSAAQKCTTHLHQPPEVMETSGCRHQRAFITCMDQLVANCPNAAIEFSAMRQSASDAFESLCSDFECPSDIEDDVEDVISWCMRDIYGIEPTSQDYCRELRQIPECIEGVKDLCPPDLEPYRLNDALSMLHDIIDSNCQPTFTPPESLALTLDNNAVIVVPHD